MRNRLALWTRWAAMGAVLAILLAPVAVRAGVSRFGDVEDTNVFLNDIEWMADIGVTRGCNPPVNDMFCPKTAVTREQMAAFMHRQAQYYDHDTDGVVDGADTVGGYYPWDLSAAYALHDDSDWIGFGDSDWTVALELQVDPPGDGMVYMTGIIEYLLLDGERGNLSVILCTDLDCGPDNWSPIIQDNGDQIVTTAVLPVDGDGDVLRLWMRAPNLGPIDVMSRQLTALYVPFGFAVDCDETGCETIEPGDSQGVLATPPG